MAYWSEKGKFQNNFHYFWNKFVPKKGPANTVEGEFLRKLNYIYYRRYNDGDSYGDLIEINYIDALSNNTKFNKELGTDIINKVETLLEIDTDKSYDEVIDIFLKYLMLKEERMEKFEIQKVID